VIIQSRNAFRYFANRPCIGTRKKIFSEGSNEPTLGDFEFLTYEEIGRRFKNFGRGMRTILNKDSLISICGINSIDWLVSGSIIMHFIKIL
jgi:long-subunit acyl-CoA synthetase (AMP-forming)